MDGSPHEQAGSSVHATSAGSPGIGSPQTMGGNGTAGGHPLGPAGSPTSMPGGPPPAFPGMPPPPAPEDLVPVVHTPLCVKLDAEPALLVLVPGGFLFPKDYGTLVEALKHAAQNAGLPLWVAVAAVDWGKLCIFDPAATMRLIEEGAAGGLQAAQDHGYSLNQAFPSGLCDNLFFALHSMAAFAAPSPTMMRSAGVVLLGANLIASDAFLPSAATFPRPLLQIFGEMDGQMHQCKAALAAADAAIDAPRLGRRCCAFTRPVALVQGMNHAQFSNGVVNVARGDLEPTANPNQAAREVARLVAAFAVAHCQQRNMDSEVRDAAVDILEDATVQAAQQLAPYARALGRVSAEDLLVAKRGSSAEEEVTAAALARARGAEVVPATAPFCGLAAHPGELAEAERFAVRAQYCALEEVLGEEAAGVIVAATVHTSLDTFTHSQAQVLPCREAGAGVAVQVQVLLHRDAYQAEGPAKYAPTASMSPVLYLKLKSGEQVVTAISPNAGVSSGQWPPVSASLLASELYEEALVLVGVRARENYQRRGCEQLVFKDERISANARPQEWLRAPVAIGFDPETRTATAALPCATTPVMRGEAAMSGGAARYGGALYIKVPSLAWMVEWILVAGLRQQQASSPRRPSFMQGTTPAPRE